MNIVKTNIEGVLIIEPRLFRDARGYFFESFSEREFEEKNAHIMRAALAMHDAFLKKGDMRLTDFGKYFK